ncbi:rhodanese-like domain-containing protein [Gluconacetobacter diazotrophicus]|uniref:Rhodanese-like domain-containing protein n=1 Tax=Gluconacetobacter diazotrophicus TaxID=33996 RepID=A0A7W4I7Q1_GLUDI|nr:rhodanese-like domain-containing protein [Gluconacetobacter diazotrophicus]MBB2157775.1 rhodanese-like domain-containing protein [Gluconacetobacter diazotrophicus]
MIDDVTPGESWTALNTRPQAQLVDVRTDAEWMFVGLPDLAGTGKQVLPISWQALTGQPNPRFVEQLKAAGLTPESEIHFICRSGARSHSAAMAARMAGFTHVFNVAGGFEGPPDSYGHRGTVAGWKAEGLPWRQS